MLPARGSESVAGQKPATTCRGWDAAAWSALRARYEAWWRGENDRPLIKAVAPLQPDAAGETLPEDEPGLLAWLTDPALVIPRLARDAAHTYHAGDAFPVIFPMYTGIPAILAAYLGSPVRLMREGLTGWLAPIITDWRTRPTLDRVPDGFWWQATQDLLAAAADASTGDYAIGIPDLQGGGEILAVLRGSQELALDLYDHPAEIVPAIAESNAAWLTCYRACFAIIHRNPAPLSQGYVDWLGVWSDTPAVTVECDFAALVSPPMFRRFFLPALEEQVGWIGRTIFHLDGPRALPHLDTLLGLRGLTGIQWGPGDGAPPMREWVPLLQKIQAAGKRQVLICEPADVPVLISELQPEGLLLSVGCGSPAEADALVAYVHQQFS